eukprot:scaffold2675_cov236-Pinguiococcus_pyrenoidosus.AAC.9
MGDDNIKIILRIRPSKRASGFLEEDPLEEGQVAVKVPLSPSERASWIVNNSRTFWQFRFNSVLGPECSQEETFDAVGRDAVSWALQGFNATVFAYGQTGSGKTFTITGGAERYADRGLIPRAVSLVFSKLEEADDTHFQAFVSYLEIYNDQGFDLLAEERSAPRLEDLPKVSMLEDENGHFHLKNLGMHRVASEEEALNFLFLGDTNRAISETAMNKTSSRSHCIFTISLEARRHGADVVKRSKLHFVDLAGSERVAKTGTSGQTLKEAQYINSSLFFLEMVIKALHERSSGARTHIPYRNSMMTSVLRDSLGGNCKTIMVATVNPEAEHTEETISTARFAQRVSLIKNNAQVNEETDPAIVIQRLKAEVKALREEVEFLKGETGEEESLSDAQISALQAACAEYVATRDPEAQLSIGRLSVTRIKDCFAILKGMVLQARSEQGSGAEKQAGGGPSAKEVARLQEVLRQRDEEIAILVNMVHQGKGPPGVPLAPQSNANQREVLGPKASTEQAPLTVAGVGPPPDMKILDSPQKAFEWFRQKCPRSKPLEENKEELRVKYGEAKEAGAKANDARQQIQYLKQTIENLRREQAVDGLLPGAFEEKAPAALQADVERFQKEEDSLKGEIDLLKRTHQEGFTKLRRLKKEIEQIQRMMEKCRANIQTDFDRWYTKMLDTSQEPRKKLGASGEKRLPYLTGNQEADADIMAFYKAKEQLQRHVPLTSPSQGEFG